MTAKRRSGSGRTALFFFFVVVRVVRVVVADDGGGGDAMRLRKRITENEEKSARPREENVSNNAAIKRYPISTSNRTKTVLRRRRVTAPVVHLESLPACYQPPSSPTFCSRTLPITLFRRVPSRASEATIRPASLRLRRRTFVRQIWRRRRSTTTPTISHPLRPQLASILWR